MGMGFANTRAVLSTAQESTAQVLYLISPGHRCCCSWHSVDKPAVQVSSQAGGGKHQNGWFHQNVQGSHGKESIKVLSSDIRWCRKQGPLPGSTGHFSLNKMLQDDKWPIKDLENKSSQKQCVIHRPPSYLVRFRRLFAALLYNHTTRAKGLLLSRAQ